MIDRPATLALGVDLGGTKILTAVADAAGRLLSHDNGVTPAGGGQEAVVGAILESAERAMSQAGVTATELAAVGIGAAGLLELEAGVLLTSPNLPGLKDVPLRSVFEAKLGVRTYLINDANAAAVGELHYGAGRGARDFIYITVSTGIGGGIIIDGEIYAGAAGTAGELGHMVIDDEGPQCACGNRGCWETLASGTALAREARGGIRRGETTSILEYAGGDPEKITAESVYKAAQAGDRLAASLIARTAYYLGVGLANLVNIFNPEVIVIGGGLSNMGDMLLVPAYEEAERRAFQQSFQAVRFARAELGGNSGVLGAIAYALAEARK